MSSLRRDLLAWESPEMGMKRFTQRRQVPQRRREEAILRLHAPGIRGVRPDRRFHETRSGFDSADPPAASLREAPVFAASLRTFGSLREIPARVKHYAKFR